MSDGRLENFSRLLTKEELLECYSAAEPEVVKERVLARAFVRTVLSGYAAGAPSPTRLSFHRNAHGKPALEWPRCTEAGQQLHFNLTHTGSLIGDLLKCVCLALNVCFLTCLRRGVGVLQGMQCFTGDESVPWFLEAAVL